MATHAVSDDILYHPDTKAYFTLRADRRTLGGFREALQMLGLPVPDYAQPKHSVGRVRAIRQALAADYPAQLSTELEPRRPNASPEAVAAAKLRNALPLS